MQTKVPNPGNLPDEIVARDEIAQVEIITQVNVHDIIREVEEGKREPLNHIMIAYSNWLVFAEYMTSLEHYITQAEPMLRRWQKLFLDSLDKNAAPPSN